MKNVSKILRGIIYTGLFTVLFVPFIVNDQFFFPFIAPKGFFFRIVTEIIFTAWLLLALRDSTYRPKKSWLLYAAGAFLMSLFISAAVSENPYKSFWSNFERMEGVISYIHIFLYFVVAGAMLNTEKLWNRFLNTSLVASFLMGIFNVLQLAGRLTINQGGVRIDGTFGNASYLAVYLLFHIFIAFLFFARSGNKYRVIYGTHILFLSYLLYQTQTRGAILGLLGGLFLTAVCIAFKDENKKARRYAYTLVGTVLVIIGGFLLIRNTEFVKNSPTLSRFSEISFENTKTQSRYYIWPMAFKGFLERPIFGWGQESFNYVFNKYYDSRLYKHELWFDRTHNVILDWLIATGIVGFSLYLSLFGIALWMLWRSGTFSLRDKSIITGLFAAYFFHNLFVFDNLMSSIMFFIMLAYIYQTTSQEKRIAETVNFPPSTHRIATAAILAVSMLFMYAANVRPILAGTAIIDGLSPRADNDISKNLESFKQAIAYHTLGDAEAREHLAQTTNRLIRMPQVPDNLKQDFFGTASAELDKQLEKTPNDTRYLMFAGVVANTAGLYDKAVEYLERAKESSPGKQSVYFELGTAYLGMKNYPKAFEVFKTAYDLEPSYQEAKIIYAVGAIYTGNDALVQQLLAELPENLFHTDDRILRAYMERRSYTTIFSILAKRIAIEPENSQHYVTRAAVYLDQGNREGAIADLQKAISVDPNFKEQGEYYISEIRAGRTP